MKLAGAGAIGKRPRAFDLLIVDRDRGRLHHVEPQIFASAGRNAQRQGRDILGLHALRPVGIEPRSLPMFVECVDGDPADLVIAERVGLEVDRLRELIAAMGDDVSPSAARPFSSPRGDTYVLCPARSRAEA